MKKRTPQRRRTVHFHFMANEKEAELIHDRMKSMGITSFGAYFRKMGIDGYFIQLDLSSVRELVTLLSRCSNNLNQYARRANETGSIYIRDIKKLQNQLDDIWTQAKDVLTKLAQI